MGNEMGNEVGDEVKANAICKKYENCTWSRRPDTEEIIITQTYKLNSSVSPFIQFNFPLKYVEENPDVLSDDEDND